MLGLIHVGPDVGFGVYGVLCPALSHLTQQHLKQLPATVKEEFPCAQSIALAGRLPGLMTAAGEPATDWQLAQLQPWYLDQQALLGDYFDDYACSDLLKRCRTLS